MQPAESAVPPRVLGQHLRNLRMQAGLTTKLAAGLTSAGRVSPGDDTGQPGVPDPAPAAPSGIAWRLLPVLAPSVAVVVADQGIKLWALSRLADHQAIVLPGGWMELRLISNPGAAFSVDSGWTWIFTLCATAAVAVLSWFAVRARSRAQAVALGLLLGGAAGNLLDRLFRAPGPGVGRVVDFIDYHGWFVGDVADIAIVAGAGLLILRATADHGPRSAAAPVPDA